MVELIAKTGKGTTWYTKKENIFKNGYVEAISKDGFKTIINIDDYKVIKY